ncbi:MAG: DUF2029 domain-containing protein, partial [Sphingomonas bacterium]|nr:DUF2029 domain-containing protein [Sphingomonas bacterium]
YGGYALWHHRTHRPLWVAIGVAPVAAFVAWTAYLSPEGFVFGVFQFPAIAPDQYYRAAGRAGKLGALTKTLDILKFLALGPALFALIRVGFGLRPRRAILPAILILAGVVAALLPSPTWRQYLLPVLPPLFVALALVWTRRPPIRAERIAAVVFAVAGLAPSFVAVVSGGGMVTALGQNAAIRTALAQTQARGPVATLSPEFVAGSGHGIDPRFAAGPFYFRSVGLLGPDAERARILVSHRRLTTAPLPPTILTGGEGRWTSGDDQLDALLATRAQAAGYHATPVKGGRFTLWTARQAARARLSAITAS